MKTIYLSGIVGYEITADSIRAQIDETSKEKLQVIVNSPGGFEIDAYEIYNLFYAYKGEVEFVISAVAASAMSYILMSGSKISSFKNSIFMAHRTQAVAFGDADEMLRQSEIARSMDNILAEAYTKKIKKKKEEILEDLKNEIWFIGWEELTSAGIIDNVIDSPEEIDIPNVEIKEQIIFMNNEMEKYSNIEKKQNMKLSILQCANRIIKDTDRIKTNSMKAAALLTNFKSVEPVENKNIQEVMNMTLQEFLKTNPDAKAEYENSLLSAEAKGKFDTDEIIISERQRICSILNKSADVKLNETTVEALNKGWDLGQFAIAEIERQNSMRAGEKKEVFSNLSIKQIPAEQDQSGKTEIEKFEAKLEAAVQKLRDEKKGGKI